MTESLAFFFAAAVALAGAAVVAWARDPSRISGGLLAVSAGGSALMLLVEAPAAAALSGVMGALAALTMGWARAAESPDPGGEAAERDAGPGRGRWRTRAIRRGLGGLALFALAWIFAGTMARQYLSYGDDLAGRPGFGAFEALVTLLDGRFFPAAAALALMGAAAIYALVAHLDEADRGAERGASEGFDGGAG